MTVVARNARARAGDRHRLADAERAGSRAERRGGRPRATNLQVWSAMADMVDGRVTARAARRSAARRLSKTTATCRARRRTRRAISPRRVTCPNRRIIPDGTPALSLMGSERTSLKNERKLSFGRRGDLPGEGHLLARTSSSWRRASSSSPWDLPSPCPPDGGRLLRAELRRELLGSVLVVASVLASSPLLAVVVVVRAPAPRFAPSWPPARGCRCARRATPELHCARERGLHRGGNAGGRVRRSGPDAFEFADVLDALPVQPRQAVRVHHRHHLGDALLLLPARGADRCGA